MGLEIVFFTLVFILLVVIIVFQRTAIVIAKRERRRISKEIAKEREATADILRLSRDVITAGSSDEEFLMRLVEYLQRTLQGDGAAALTCRNDKLYGCAVAGIFPPLLKVTSQVEQQLLAHDAKHTEFFNNRKLDFTAGDMEEYCGSKDYALFKGKYPAWFPSSFIKNAPITLYAPIYKLGETVGAVMITSKDDFDAHQLSEADGVYLERLAELASLCLEVIQVIRERKEYEARLQSAREEGMLQVSTGIIHNIGNAITVAKLSVIELQEKISKADERPEDLILQELLPTLREQLEKGTLDTFLKEDPAGSQYFDIITELLTHIGESVKSSSATVKSLSSKLLHISEIIELQQRFVGELGTENMTQLAGVLESSIKIFEETCNKRAVKIESDFEQGTPEVLVDPSMMTQVFMNLIKNAVEAMDAYGGDQPHVLKLGLQRIDKKDKTFVQVEVKDNGPGIPEDIQEHVFEFGFSTKGKGQSRGFGLHSCMDTVRKYGGSIELETATGKGTSFKVLLPVNTLSENVEESKEEE